MTFIIYQVVSNTVRPNKEVGLIGKIPGSQTETTLISKYLCTTTLASHLIRYHDQLLISTDV